MFQNYCTIYLNLVVPICISKNLMYYGNPPYLYCKLWISASSRQKQSYDLCGSLCYWQAIAPFLIAIYGISVFAQSYLLLYMYSSSNFHSLKKQEKGSRFRSELLFCMLLPPVEHAFTLASLLAAARAPSSFYHITEIILEATSK